MLGLISAASLPLGTVTARFWTPGNRVIAAMMAFGAGALLSALTIDIVGNALEEGQFYALSIGCVIGGLFFFTLNQIVNNKGGFLRKSATTISFLKRKKRKEYKQISKELSNVTLLNHLPPEEIYKIIPFVSKHTYKQGYTIIKQGDPGNSMFIVESGEVDIIDTRNNSKKIATLHADDILGEMALVTGEPRSGTAIAVTDTTVWMILKEHFDRLIRTSPEICEAVKTLTKKRIADLQYKKTIQVEQATSWLSKANKHIDNEVILPTKTDIKDAVSEHGGAPLAIWLGIMLDGIPESIVIGSSMIHHSVSFSLIAGLFLSNYPESLSSSLGMREQGHSFFKVLMMWMSIMILTGIGAFVGNAYLVGAPDILFVIVEGIAAGAMLTMIAETMLPEAYHKGGAITGLSTLLGFLTALLFKTFGQ